MFRPARQSSVSVAGLCLLAAAGAGCSGGDGSGLEADAPSAPPAGGEPFDAAFSAIQANVFTPTCAVAGCHEGAGAPQGLRLDAANSHGLLVNRPSSEVPELLRVEPHDPDASYLIRKLEGTAAVGGRMPLGGPPLEQPVIDVIRQWIAEGAIDDRVSSSGPIRVTSLSPLPGSVLEAAPTEVIAMFDRELDVSTVNATTFVLEGSGADGTFDDGNEIAVTAASVNAAAQRPMSASFVVGEAGLSADTYRVLLRGAGGSLVLDIDANALDGEFSDAFPSGDAQAGGDFEATFTVSAPATGADR